VAAACGTIHPGLDTRDRKQARRLYSAAPNAEAPSFGSRVFYRIVSTDKPTPDGFFSYKELGIRVSPNTEAMRHLAEGLSVYEC
jgi:hypothetical protein